jgi:hypothetical protein
MNYPLEMSIQKLGPYQADIEIAGFICVLNEIELGTLGEDRQSTIETLRTQLIHKLDKVEKQKEADNSAHAIYHCLKSLAEIAPINHEEVSSTEPIDPENAFYSITGHQFDIKCLVNFIQTKGEYKNYLANDTFHLMEQMEIKEQADLRDLGLMPAINTQVNEPIIGDEDVEIAIIRPVHNLRTIRLGGGAIVGATTYATLLLTEVIDAHKAYGDHQAEGLWVGVFLSALIGAGLTEVNVCSAVNKVVSFLRAPLTRNADVEFQPLEPQNRNNNSLNV